MIELRGAADFRAGQLARHGPEARARRVRSLLVARYARGQAMTALSSTSRLLFAAFLVIRRCRRRRCRSSSWRRAITVTGSARPAGHAGGSGASARALRSRSSPRDAMRRRRLSRAARFDFGRSLANRRRPVAELISDATVNTATLVVTALLLARAGSVFHSASSLGTHGGGVITGRDPARSSVSRFPMPPLLLALLVFLPRPDGFNRRHDARRRSSDRLHHMSSPVLALALPLSAL